MDTEKNTKPPKIYTLFLCNPCVVWFLGKLVMQEASQNASDKGEWFMFFFAMLRLHLKCPPKPHM